uniref:Uncharacterized protein n=1 Tax=Trichuris muris TaxID=70415 RepID=A0A5S6QVW4_TRIMR
MFYRPTMKMCIPSSDSSPLFLAVQMTDQFRTALLWQPLCFQRQWNPPFVLIAFRENAEEEKEEKKVTSGGVTTTGGRLEKEVQWPLRRPPSADQMG